MDSLAFLSSLEVLGMKFGLENMTALCAELNHPEQAFRSVIVAGTNGKGSVTSMVSAALHAAGHSVARYTSPHLQRLEERFVIGEQEIATDELKISAEIVRQAIDRLVRSGRLEQPPTFFEATTAVAFHLFKRAGIQLAVLEVGLGGRLDATNVVSPLVAAITSIDLDHQAQLGNTIAEVAREKAGVIKVGIPVVCGPVPAEAEAVIATECRKKGARLIRVGDDVRVATEMDDRETRVTIETPKRRLENVRLALQGQHQASNAATVVGVIDELDGLGIPIDDRAVLAGLTRSKWPGRLERFERGGCEVLLDAAHNPAGARALAAFLRDRQSPRVTLLFGAMRDKDVRGMLAALQPFCRALVCTTAANRRALRAEELVEIASSLALPPDRIEAVADPEAALRRACELGSPVVAAGSIFLIGPLRGILR